MRLPAAILLLFFSAGFLFAQCPPLDENSIITLGVFDRDACGVTGTMNWCPGIASNLFSTFTVEVTLRGAENEPCPECSLEVVGLFQGIPKNPPWTLSRSERAYVSWIEDTQVKRDTIDTLGPVPVITGDDGAVLVEFSGGGCGCVGFSGYAVVTGAGGFVLVPAEGVEMCVKSPDINGNGIVNFLDTFIYAPILHVGGSDYWADYNCNGVVNFVDTFTYAAGLVRVGIPGEVIGEGPCSPFCE
ncbi:MAG: hypothetical protein ABIH26_10080 [Candidatus Eisenbacteria bacterium]